MFSSILIAWLRSKNTCIAGLPDLAELQAGVPGQLTTLNDSPTTIINKPGAKKIAHKSPYRKGKELLCGTRLFVINLVESAGGEW